jgi:peptidoglycan-associated lipoprotein
MRKQSILSEVDSNFREVNPFEGIDTSDEASYREAQLSEDLARKVAEVLQPVYFNYNSYQLSPDAIARIVKIANFLKENSGIRILIEGHCDERGSSEYNLGLGEMRARIIQEYLLSYGIPGIQLAIMSMGREMPVHSGCMDEQCHTLNRRSEFKPLGR